MNSNSNQSTHPPFPEPGSTIGPDGKFFCLGRLGKGTFCAIHKCIDLSYPHTWAAAADGDEPSSNTNQSNHNGDDRQRIVAAKVELANFVDSGVIDGEASVLKFLDASLPPGMVPTFVDYVRQSASSITAALPSSSSTVTPGPSTDKLGPASDGGLSAIIMECLPGEDMHLLRDRHCQSVAEKQQQQQQGTSDGGGNGNNGVQPISREKAPRRLAVEDAVYLVADVMLPLLKAMHEVGMVHRDVKPSVSVTYVHSHVSYYVFVGTYCLCFVNAT